MTDKNAEPSQRPIRRQDDGLGVNSDIGTKLRALYGAIEREDIPSTMLDLLEKLDQVEMSSQGAARKGKSA
jgi:hypothetical protein